MTPSGIEPATFGFVAQHLNHCATAVPQSLFNALVNYVQLLRCESDKHCSHNPDEEWVGLLVLLY